MRPPQGVPTVRGMSDEHQSTDRAIEDQLTEARTRISELERDLVDSDLLFDSHDDFRMPTKLRDVVRGQVLALLSAESREAVRCATNALGDALDKTAPPSKDDDETAEDRIAALLDNPVTQTMIQKGLEYFCPAPPPAPTPNLTVTGPRGCWVAVNATVDGKSQMISSRIIGASGVIKMVVINQTVEIVTRVHPRAEAVAMVLDFTEESHELDAVMMADSLRRSKEAKDSQPIVTPPPAAKKRPAKRAK